MTASEAQAIASGFAGAPSADESLPALLRLLSSYSDAELDRTVVSVLEAAMAAPRIPFWVPEVIGQVVARSGWRDWGAAIWVRYLEDRTLREVWPAVAETCICPVFRRRRSGSKRESPAAGEERFRLRPKPGSLLLRGARGLEAETAGLSKQRRRPGAIAGDPGALFVGAAQVVTALRVARLAGAIEERRGFDGVG